MKKKRLTLGEIKIQLYSIEEGLLAFDGEQNSNLLINIDSLREQFRKLEAQLLKLKPLVDGLDGDKAGVLPKQIVFQSMSYMHALMIFLTDIETML
jgi:hypothetical protein